MADNLWIRGDRDRSILGSLHEQLVSRLTESGYRPNEVLDSTEEIVLVEKLLEEVPGSLRLRKLRAYLLVQLGRWTEADREFNDMCRRPNNGTYIPASKALFDIYNGRQFESGYAPIDLKAHAKNANSFALSMLSIVSLLREQNGVELTKNVRVDEWANQNKVAECFLLYRLGEYDDAIRISDTHGGVFLARDSLLHVIRALCLIAKGDLIKAEAEMDRANALIDAFGFRDGVPRPQNETSYYTSVIWLEPIVLMREAESKLAEARALPPRQN